MCRITCASLGSFLSSKRHAMGRVVVPRRLEGAPWVAIRLQHLDQPITLRTVLEDREPFNMDHPMGQAIVALDSRRVGQGVLSQNDNSFTNVRGGSRGSTRQQAGDDVIPNRLDVPLHG